MNERDNILIGDENGQHDQKREADQIHKPFALAVERLAAQTLDHEEEHPAAVQRGQRKQVHDTEIHRDDHQPVENRVQAVHKRRAEADLHVIRHGGHDADHALHRAVLHALPCKQADQQVLDLIPKKVPTILVINKIDTVEKETLLPVIAAYKDLLDFTDVIPISAKWHDGLDSLMQVCEGFAQPGPFMFPEGISTDMPEKQVMAEIIREKLLWNLEKEIPHGTAVEVTKFSERDDGIIDLDATIYCEKASHKGIIIGKNGQMLKKISSDARKDCERFMGTKVFLQTWVRVKENWRDSDFMISNFGYHKD